MYAPGYRMSFLSFFPSSCLSSCTVSLVLPARVNYMVLPKQQCLWLVTYVQSQLLEATSSSYSCHVDTARETLAERFPNSHLIKPWNTSLAPVYVSMHPKESRTGPVLICLYVCVMWRMLIISTEYACYFVTWKTEWLLHFRDPLDPAKRHD